MTGILFDLDGTLLDTLQDLTDSVNYALSFHGYPTRTVAEVRRFVGNGAARLIALSVPEGADPAPVLDTYQAHYRLHSQDKTAPYPGIPEALAALKEKYPIAVVSNKPDPAVKVLCAQFFPGIYALGETADCPRKPAPDMLYKAMAQLGVDRCIYVGDSDVDVITAGNAGFPCVSVLWGFRDEPEIRAVGGSHFCRQTSLLAATIEDLIGE
jgi:phosphoglycolate phosphatase